MYLNLTFVKNVQIKISSSAIYYPLILAPLDHKTAARPGVALTVVRLVALLRLKRLDQRNDAQLVVFHHLLVLPGLPAAARRLAVNLELCTRRQVAGVLAVDPALDERALRQPVHRVAHQRQVALGAVAASLPALVRV